jgi:murein DD-endopeptidase MepM/ murein hydrolase activator NlpD
VTTADAASGNHIMVDAGSGHYIMYAHLVPGSPTVQVGDVVQRGFVLGNLGNSGNSTPHLHFQVMDRPSSLGANGLPFVFDSMKRAGTILKIPRKRGKYFRCRQAACPRHLQEQGLYRQDAPGARCSRLLNPAVGGRHASCRMDHE